MENVSEEVSSTSAVFGMNHEDQAYISVLLSNFHSLQMTTCRILLLAVTETERSESVLSSHMPLEEVHRIKVRNRLT